MRLLTAHPICPTRKILPALALGILSLSIAQPAREVPCAPRIDDQSCAVGSLCTINNAEINYAKEYGKGFSPTLIALRAPPEGKELSPEAAGFVDDYLTGGRKCNFIFKYKAGARGANGKINTYTVTAQPVIWGKGAKSFFTDQTAEIRWTDQNRLPRASDPALQLPCGRGPNLSNMKRSDASCAKTFTSLTH